jgi:mannose-6-phosphate isomerase-like protein (cupin superfamily)
MSEVYYVERGRGTARCPGGEIPVAAGDWFVHPPGEPHNLTNTGGGDLVYIVIADNVADRATIHAG